MGNQYRCGRSYSAEFRPHGRIVRQYPLDEAVCRRISGALVSWNERRKGRKNYMATNHRDALGERCAVFLQLVAAGTAASDGCEHGLLHTDRIGRIYLPAHGRRVDVPSAEKQSDGRRIQYRERIVPAGDAPLD